MKNKKRNLKEIEDLIHESTILLEAIKIRVYEPDVLLMDSEDRVVAQIDPSGHFSIEENIKLAKLFLASYKLLDACKTAKLDTEMLLNGECLLSDESLLSTIEVLAEAINGLGK